MSDPALTVTLDDTDYAPGETVKITATAANLAVGSSITFNVDHVLADPDGTPGTTDDILAQDLSGTGIQWTVTDGGADDIDGVANGIIVTKWEVGQDAVDQAFLLSATDVATGDVATAAFTDANPTVTASDFTIVDNGDGTITASVLLDVTNGTIDTDSSGDGKATEVHLFNSCSGTTQPGGGGSYFLTWDNVLNTSGTPGGDGYYSITYTLVESDFAGPDGKIGTDDDCCEATFRFDNVIVKFENVNGTSSKTSPGDPSVTVDNPYSDDECDDNGQAELALTKDTVCPDDPEHSVNGGTILADKPIEWVYTLTNTGDPGTSVSDITLTDSVLGTLYANGTLSDGVTLQGDTNNVGQLDSDEIWTFTYTGTSTAGDYSNQASATGTDTGTSNALNVDSEPNSYYGATASVSIVKEVSCDGETWFDANDPTGPVILAGFDVFFRVTVTNNTDGGLALTGADVEDNTGLDFTFSGIQTVDLAAGESIVSDVIKTTVQAGQQTDTASVSGTVSDACDNTASLDDSGDSDDANYYGATAGINIEKLISVDGGTNWYFLADDDDDTIEHISDITGISEDHLHIGTPTVFAGKQLKYEIVVTNTSDGGLTANDIVVTDNTYTLTGVATSLAAGASDVSDVLTVTAGTTAVTNTASVSATVSDDCENDANVSDSDSVTYNVFNPAAELTQGYWGSHLQAWDGLPGLGKTTSTSDVPAEANPLTGKLLLGDLNHNGVADGGEVGHTLLIDLAAAQAIESGATSGDDRVIMLAQAVATQLDINNGYNKYGVDNLEPHNLITEAVDWLKATSGVLADGVLTGQGTVSKAGVLTGGEWGTSSNKFFLGAGSTTWGSDQTFGSVSGINGEDIKNALMWFNQGQLVVSQDGNGVAWNNGGTLENPNTNAPDNFWLTLSAEHLV